MSPKSRIVIAALAALVMLPVVGAALPATAQTAQAPLQQAKRSHAPPRARPRIEINPRPLLYRRCEVQYVVQYRPSGTVLFPAQHCWWVRG